ncbi:MAG TPA: hypothetical protein VEH04_02645 [Verrucomicrobiae bacterium]|nr:hypothetical protein [Verrucomicrobiae bacterium]
MPKQFDISAFYYLNYPDSCPVDDVNAGSEVRVELGGEGARLASFDFTVSVFVCTPGFLEKRVLIDKNGIFLQNAIIVRRFRDETVRQALEEHLDLLIRLPHLEQ